jgi:hypothetical protein
MKGEIILLKEALQKRTGIALDGVMGCKRLDTWLKLRGVYISYSTLSRIFGLATLHTSPREGTLNDLVSILGYSNFKEFLLFESSKNLESIVPFDLQFSFERALFDKKLSEASLLYLQMVENSFSAKVFSKDLSKALFKNLSVSKKALSHLASSPFGRESFFLTFIDEDDVSGNYRRSLNEFFLPLANDSEKHFVELYALRKDILSLKKTNIKKNSSLLQENFGNIHLKARALEIELLKVKTKQIAQQEKEVGALSEAAYSMFCNCSKKSEELAVLGRFARGVLYAGVSNFILEHKNILQAMLILLQQPLVDYEFQVPIYALLCQVNHAPNLPILQPSSWSNAYYSSAVFLLSKESRKQNELFFQSTMGIHKSFLYAY